MSDTSWIRAHNGVGIYTSGQIYSSSSIRMGNILLEHTNEINNSLSSVGYRLSGSKKCKEIDNKKAIELASNYQVCIYEYDDSTRGKYYKVIAYMYFDVPVVGGILNIPVSGETKVFYD